MTWEAWLTLAVTTLAVLVLRSRLVRRQPPQDSLQRVIGHPLQLLGGAVLHRVRHPHDQGVEAQ